SKNFKYLLNFNHFFPFLIIKINKKTDFNLAISMTYVKTEVTFAFNVKFKSNKKIAHQLNYGIRLKKLDFKNSLLILI
ncbi:MAG: hypothetical protein ACRC57_07880, partial [Sarcina sp.]